MYGIKNKLINTMDYGFRSFFTDVERRVTSFISGSPYDLLRINDDLL